MRMSSLLGVAGIASALLASPDTEGASKCTALKYKHAAKAAVAKATCKATAVRTGAPVDPACLAAVDAKLAERWARAAGKADCIATDDLVSAETAVAGFIDELMDALEPPPVTAVCCQTGNSCWHGSGFPDEAACVQFGGTPGAMGTVCDSATGSCGPLPAGPGRCCYLPSFQVCNGGPSIDLAGCVAAGGLDFPFAAVCQPNGACTFGSP